MRSFYEANLTQVLAGAHLLGVVVFYQLSGQSSGSCSFQEQQRILGLFELSHEFKQQHYLAGLLLTELSAALDMESEGYGGLCAVLLQLCKYLSCPFQSNEWI